MDPYEPQEAEARNFFNKEMPVWLIMVIFLFLVMAAGGLFYYFRIINFNYTVQVAAQSNKQNTLQYGPIPALANSD